MRCTLLRRMIPLALCSAAACGSPTSNGYEARMPDAAAHATALRDAGSGPVAAMGMDAATSVQPLASGNPAIDGILSAACFKSSVKSALLPTNILFVIDRSGSMMCNPPPTTDSAACEKAPARSDAKLPSKWEVTTSALIAALATLPSSASVGISYFSNDDACGVSSKPSVPIAANSTAQQGTIEASLKSVMPAGGTPIVGATILAYKHLHEAALAGEITGNQYVVLITDGQQSEQCGNPGVCDSAKACTDYLLSDAVPKAAGAGSHIKTFVIGVPGSEPARSVLSEIAQEGGTAADGCDPKLGNCHFDMTKESDLASALAKALAKITGQTIACELPVPQPDQGALDLGAVNVVYTPGKSGAQATLVTQDAHKPCEAGANGWQYTADHTQIRLCGALCDTIRADTGARVDVALGCPVVVQ
jgi:hypothetical protein